MVEFIISGNLKKITIFIGFLGLLLFCVLIIRAGRANRFKKHLSFCCIQVENLSTRLR